MRSLASVSLMLLACLSCVASGYDSMGLAFNETMKGFQSSGDQNYTAAYANGKQTGDIVTFDITSSIENVTMWASDLNRSCAVAGMITARGITPTSGAAVQPGAYLKIFDGGISNDTLYLHYFLPFTGADGKKYSLQGTKYLFGNDCIELEKMFTTLYFHILTGWNPLQGNIITTGIVTIDPIGILELFNSLRFLGNGTDADKLNAVVLFGGVVESSLVEACLNTSNFGTNFWYIWVSSGTQGFLLDLIERPDELELRLDLYDSTHAAPPAVLKQYLPRAAFAQAGPLTVAMGGVKLWPGGCTGQVDGANVSAAFALSTRANTFVPADLEGVVLRLLPNVTSHYGALQQPAEVGGVAYAAGLPLVYTAYPVPAGLGHWQWAMISAMRVPGTDLQVEIMALGLWRDVWAATSYVHYRGQDYHFDDPFLFQTKMPARGEVQGAVRVFAASIDDLVSLHLQLNCSAPTAQFALLDTEGDTQIHTTVLGTCEIADLRAKQTFTAAGVLLETKVPPSARCARR